MRGLALVLPTLLGLGATGCDEVLSPADPGVVSPRPPVPYGGAILAILQRMRSTVARDQ